MTFLTFSTLILRRAMQLPPCTHQESVVQARTKRRPGFSLKIATLNRTASFGFRTAGSLKSESMAPLHRILHKV